MYNQDHDWYARTIYSLYDDQGLNTDGVHCLRGILEVERIEVWIPMDNKRLNKNSWHVWVNWDSYTVFLDDVESDALILFQ